MLLLVGIGLAGGKLGGGDFWGEVMDLITPSASPVQTPLPPLNQTNTDKTEKEGKKVEKNPKEEARRLFANDNYLQAADMATKALKSNANDAEMLELIGEIHLRRGDNDKLAEHLAYMQQQYADADVTKYLAFRSDLVAFRFSEALATIRSLGTDIPPKYRFYRGVLLAMLNDHRAAAEDFAEVAKTSDNNLRNKAQKMQESYAQHDFAQEAKDPYLFTLLAKSLAELHEYPIARAMAEIALQEQPEYTDAWIVRGYSFLMMEEYDLAIQDLLKAHGMDQTRAETLYLLGISNQKKQQLEQSIAFLEQAYEIQSAFAPEIKQTLMALYLQTGERYKWEKLKEEL